MSNVVRRVKIKSDEFQTSVKQRHRLTQREEEITGFRILISDWIPLSTTVIGDIALPPPA